ncbi:gliding motility protein GldC [Hymenobacter ruricola]|jgi:gliding motility-associated protein GldC|uniref:Gliding motility protein GldC n=1 Tax=Hymenobacter ruricola TaxID=2791023 RepID=A0ABS0I2A3_9BACT|nr:gliding motility protein GldC [Hymenobacter ruricola]MBF9220858.1 gliding motility protein GldC [Hymenobacter ruricola]
MKKSEIRFSIALDDNKVPEAISWSATDAGPDIHFAKAINIALWDREQVGTMKIDLWTKDMPVDEMKRFVVDNIGSMAENIVTATDDKEMANKMRALCKELSDYLDKQEQGQ